MVRLPARMRTWGKRGHGPLEDLYILTLSKINSRPSALKSNLTCVASSPVEIDQTQNE
jgi:hypothetical protein